MFRAQHSRTASAFGVVLAVVSTGLVGAAVLSSRALGETAEAARVDSRLTADVDHIRWYDEVLTSSARLAAATGDPSYVERYEQTAPLLDTAIDRAFARAPDRQAQRALTATGAANRALVRMEQLSITMVRAGQREAATRLLESPGYLREKAAYSRGMAAALEALRRSSGARTARAERTQHRVLLADLTAAATLLLVWLLTVTALRRSERRRAGVEDELRHQAHSDPLTALPNRRRFREEVAAALAGATRDPGAVTAVLLCDLDHFKTVNDLHGHGTGDALLVEVAGRLQALLPAEGGLAARLGGDEFAVLLARVTPADAERFAEALVTTLSERFDAAGDVRVSVSVGLATAEPGERDTGVLLRGADLAMYDAKSAGRRGWSRYTEAMHQALLEVAALEADLHAAVARDELVLHYQPLVRFADGTVKGVEALVRWEHPARGLLHPGHFLPLAERTDLMVAFGEHVLRRACTEVASWADTALTVAVNVSPSQLRDPDLPGRVLAIAREAGLAPQRLVLEVTETSLIDDAEVAHATLSTLRAAGVRIAIDDFGTGQSNLARLHRLPVDVVKLDRSFLDRPEGAHADDEVLLELIVSLARGLHLEVVAEGIETPEQLATVRAAGCDVGQGFLLGRPGLWTGPRRSLLAARRSA